MLRGGEAAGPYLGGILCGGLVDQRRQLGVTFDEARLELREEAEDVVGDEDLAVAGRRRADPDRRHRHGFGNGTRYRLDRAFDDQREGACLGDCRSIRRYPFGGLRSASLYPEPANGMN